MNDLHRAVLQKHGTDLVRDLLITETLLGAMFQRGIFDEEVIELIRACKTPSEQCYKILELLPKRGPEAFDSFLEILQEKCPWLARMIQDSLVTENEKMQANAVKKEEAPVTVENVRVCSASATPRGDPLDFDIKTRVSAFVQKQFGQVRRISNTDKKAIERWMAEWLQSERKSLRKAFDEAHSETSEEDVLDHIDVKEKVFFLYRQLIRKQKKDLRKKTIPKPVDHTAETGDVDMDLEQEEFITAEDATFDILATEINEMLAKYDFMEKQISRSYDYLGVDVKDRANDKDIAILVSQFYGEFRYKEKELVKERQKIEQMLLELYQYSTKTNKLENILNNQEHEIIALKGDINKYRAENVELIQEIAALERANNIHLEKEKTLADLKQAQEDLQTMLKVLNQENKELKEKVQGTKGPMKAGARGFQSRRSTLDTVNSNIPNTSTRVISPRKPAPKKLRSNSFKF